MPPPALAPDTAAQAMRGVVGTVTLKDFGALSSIFSSWATRFLSNPMQRQVSPRRPADNHTSFTVLLCRWTPGALRMVAPARLSESGK